MEVLDRVAGTVAGVFSRDARYQPHILIEGAWHDDWGKLTVNGVPAEIPPGCGTVHYMSYDFSLVKRLAEGTVRNVSPYEALTGTRFDLDTVIDGLVIERPRTIVTEDGRIYFDRHLMREENGGGTKLDHLLEAFKQHYNDQNPVKAVLAQLSSR